MAIGDIIQDLFGLRPDPLKEIMRNASVNAPPPTMYPNAYVDPQPAMNHPLASEILPPFPAVPVTPVVAGGLPAPAGPPVAPVAPPAPAVGGPATTPPGVPSGPPQPLPAASPPDLSAMYSKLIERAERKQSVNQGIGLIAAGFAAPESRSALINAAFSNSGEGNLATTVNTMLKLREDQQKQAVRQQQLAALPEIAKKFGLDLNTAKYLFESGKLDETINTLSIPNTQVVSDHTGTKIVDMRTGRMVKELGGADPAKNVQIVSTPGGGSVAVDKGNISAGTTPVVAPDPGHGIQFLSTPGGGQIAVDKNNLDRGHKPIIAPDPGHNMDIRLGPQGELVGIDKGNIAAGPTTIMQPDPLRGREVVKGAQGENIVVDKSHLGTVTPGDQQHGWTTDRKNWEEVNRGRVTSGKPPMTFEEFLSTQNRDKAPKTTVDLAGNRISEGFAKTFVDDFTKADAARETMHQINVAHNTLDRGIIAGSKLSPYELEGRKILASAFGLPREAEANTEAFLASMREVVLPKVKTLGTGNSISNADREFVEKAVGGNIELTPEAMKKILLSIERLSIASMVNYNDQINGLAKTAKLPEGTILRRVEVPRPSKQLLGTIPPKAIEYLQKNPDTAKDFDERFGHNMNALFLGNP